MQFRKLLLGTTPSGNKVYASHSDRTKHMLAIGKSGGGKSKFLESCIRQDIRDPRKPGLLLIDPHGGLYEDIVNWCAWVGVKRKIHLFNPSEPDFTPCYNPLATSAGTPDAVARSLVDGFAQVFKEESMATPMIRETLAAVLYALIERRQTIAEAPYLLRTDDEYGIREYLTSDFGENYVIKEKWNEFISLTRSQRTRHEYHNQMSSADRRLFELNLSPTVREVFGHVERSLDIAKAMHDGDIVLVNLSQARNALAESDARLIGTLMLRDVYTCAKARDETYAKRHPFYVYVDECYDFLTSDVEKMLDQTRKYGVHLVLACQRTSQLRKAGEEILDAVMTGTEIKVVFGGLSAESAKELANEIYMCEVDLHRGVERTNKPGVVGYRKDIFVDRSFSRGHTETFSENTRDGVSEFLPDEGASGGETITTQHGSGFAESETSSESESHRTVLIPEFADQYSQTWNIEELLYEKARFLKQQPIRHAVAYLHSRGSSPLVTPFVGAAPNKNDAHLTARWKARAVDDSGICLSRQAAKALIAQRHAELRTLALDHINPGEPDSYLE